MGFYFQISLLMAFLQIWFHSEALPFLYLAQATWSFICF